MAVTYCLQAPPQTMNLRLSAKEDMGSMPAASGAD